MLSSRHRANAGIRQIHPFHKIKALFIIAAFASLVLSVALWFSGAREEGLFVGLWVPAIHSLGTLVLAGERDSLATGSQS